jgi:hypothetical protein
VRVAGIGRELDIVIGTGSAATNVAGGEASTFKAGTNTVGVVTRNSSGSVVDNAFQLTVFC